MDALIFVILVAVAAGVFAGVQAPLNALTSSKLGLLEGALVPHVVGAIVALVPLLFLGMRNFRDMPAVPWYGYLPGVLGVGLVMGLSFATARIGVTATIVVFVVSQLIVGAIIGHFGWLGSPVKPLDLAKLLGIGMLIAGAWLVVRPS
ncbi:MAG: DMT family transporter [Meiothermus sp.]|nr:DMT family transporter [Meiothermus sp.]